jgi:transposase
VTSAGFPSAGHYARYNATAPIEASRGPIVRHRLNPRGNRQLNHAIHMIAVTQVRNDTPGRGYYLRKQAEGHSRKEAMRRQATIRLAREHDVGGDGHAASIPADIVLLVVGQMSASLAAS